jgi:predicted HTH transcriptional regulator
MSFPSSRESIFSFCHADYVEQIGTGINRIKNSVKEHDLENAEFYYNKFIGVIKPMFEEISNLRNQNQKLAQVRDLLLPRLMNGTIEV